MSRKMTGKPYNFLRLGYPNIEYYQIEQKSTNIFRLGDGPPHGHIESILFDDDFFEQRYKNDEDEFKKLMENYTFFLHFTGWRWYG